MLSRSGHSVETWGRCCRFFCLCCLIAKGLLGFPQGHPSACGRRWPNSHPVVLQAAPRGITLVASGSRMSSSLDTGHDLRPTGFLLWRPLCSWHFELGWPLRKGERNSKGCYLCTVWLRTYGLWGLVCGFR